MNVFAGKFYLAQALPAKPPLLHRPVRIAPGPFLARPTHRPQRPPEQSPGPKCHRWIKPDHPIRPRQRQRQHRRPAFQHLSRLRHGLSEKLLNLLARPPLPVAQQLKLIERNHGYICQLPRQHGSEMALSRAVGARHDHPLHRHRHRHTSFSIGQTDPKGTLCENGMKTL